MIPVATTTIQQGDLGGEKVAMSIDAAAMAHIMAVLTDLYSDAELAIIREYSTNALDSHIEAGTKRPIEVVLPTMLAPFLKIKDFGIGMSTEDIHNTYSRYGASTKRASDDFNGTLGLGCKSALTYTNQFSLIGVKNGVKTHVSISRTNDGATMEIVDTSATNEPNGVEVSIPVKAHNMIADKAYRFFRFWPAGTVLVNGQEPAKFEGKEIAPGIFTNESDKNDYIVMGNVAYPCTKRLVTAGGYNKPFGVVAFVKMGEVAFVPSREALNYGPGSPTNATLDRILKTVDDNVAKMIQTDINSKTTHWDAYNSFSDWMQKMGTNFVTRTKFTYKGTVFPESFSTHAYLYRPSRTRHNLDFRKTLTMDDFKGTMVVTNFVPANINGSHKSRAKDYMYATFQGASKILFVNDGCPGGVWTANAHVVDWNVVKEATKVAKDGTAALIKRDRYDVIDPNDQYGRTKGCDNITTTEIYYFSPAEREINGRVLTSYFPGATIAVINRNRWEKFVRDYPTARHVTVVARENLEKARAALTDLDKMILGLDYWEASRYKSLDDTKIDDPDLAEAVRRVKTGVKASPTANAWEKAKAFASAAGVRVGSLPTSRMGIMDKYPLANMNNLTHTYIYINAVYAANKKGN